MTTVTTPRRDWSDEIARFEGTKAKKKTFKTINSNVAQVTRHRLLDRYNTKIKITTAGSTIVFEK